MVSLLHFLLLLVLLLSGLSADAIAKKPRVVMVVLDGFRWGYQYKADASNFRKIASEGVEAEAGMVSVFPGGVTGLWSLVTGLYPAWHGVVDYHFGLPYANASSAPGSNPRFDFNTEDPSWWLGSPLWESVVDNNKTAAVFGMAGAQVPKGSWNCTSGVCVTYSDSLNRKLSPSDLVRFGLRALDHNADFVVIYIEDVDTVAHSTGPDSLQVTGTVLALDKALGQLLEGIAERGLTQSTSVLVVGDHGMVATCKERHVSVDDLGVPTSWVEATGGTLAVRPPPGVDVKKFLNSMKEKQAAVTNGDHLHIFLKEDLPKRLFFWESDRIAPIIGLLDEGYKALTDAEAQAETCGGHHRYDNAYKSMNTIFMAMGPRFRRGVKVPSFNTVEVYNVMAELLGIQGAPNNGTHGFPANVLLPDDHVIETM